ncbi:MAG: MiaB/RimO family radical SAM methylthiotransferase [Terriglobales bacterium]
MSTFYVENFGCRATQADGAAIERELLERGLNPADAPDDAQVVVLNTCTVTASADQDVRAAIRRIHRTNPGCRILVTGCYAQRAPQEIAAIPGVSAVVGNSHKMQVAEIANSLTAEGAKETKEKHTTTGDTEEPKIYVGDMFAHTELVGAPVFEAGAKTRPNLKVQDGCNNRCSFCIIPFVRGRSRSLPLDESVREVQALVDAGYREVVISGINLGRWGRDLSQAASSTQLATSDKQLAAGNEQTAISGRAQLRFVDLVRAILERTTLEKLRISSVEPMDWSDELIGLVANSPRIAQHAHVPMQSGSDRILRAMHRKYRPWHYADRIGRIRAAMPTAAIGADVMVGFPGETDADFEQTRRMVEELPFTYLHVFSYSSRPGTPSATMPQQVPPPVVKKRNRILRELAAEKKLRFMRSFVGREIEAITLNVYEDGYTEALTDNYLKLRIPGRHEPNQWARARVERVDAEGMFVIGDGLVRL